MNARAEQRANRAGFSLKVGDKDYSDVMRPRLVSLTLTEKRGDEADQLDIVLDDSDGLVPIPPKRAVIVLSLGWLHGTEVKPGLVPKGRFTVDQIEWGGPPDQVTIRARSADMTAAFGIRREAIHKATTLGAMAAAVAARHGLQPRVAPGLAGIAIPATVQHETSDMALLRRLGREHDAVATIKNGRLILNPIGRGVTDGGQTLTRLDLRRSDLADYRYQEIDRSAEAGVEARWHDTSSATRKTVKAGGGGGNGGGEDAPEPRRLRRVYHSEAKAREAAEAAAKRLKRAEATLSLTLSLGRPDLLPEQPVQILDLKPTVDRQPWLIAELTHTLQAEGLTTRMQLEVKS